MMAAYADTKTATWTMIGLVLFAPIQQVLAAAPLPNGPGVAASIRDVALQQGGVLEGQVIDSQGIPVSDTAVKLQRADRPEDTPLALRTDDEGRFQFRGLRGGVYQIEIDAGSTLCRAWSPNTAPPAAGRAVLLVQGGPIVRGQRAPDYRRIGWTLLVVGVAVGIAVPLALDDESSS